MSLSEKEAVILGGGTKSKIKDHLSQGIMKLMIILHEKIFHCVIFSIIKKEMKAKLKSPTAHRVGGSPVIAAYSLFA